MPPKSNSGSGERCGRHGKLPPPRSAAKPTAFTHQQAPDVILILILPSPPLGAERVRVRWGTAMALRIQTTIARRLRRDATKVEQRLWRALRTTCPAWKFRRQHPVGRRIVDFACPARKLAIELDGSQHADQQEADATRSAELAQYGYRVIRFWNTEVIENLDGVIQVILTALEMSESPPHPVLSAPWGGEGMCQPSASALFRQT